MTRNPSKCQVCREPYAKRSMTQKACSVECAMALAVSTRAKAERRETIKRKEQIKPRAKWIAEAQTAFNAWIRARDADLPCISCGRFHGGAWDAGHYRSVGSMPALRFNEANVHKQCVPCNQHKSGNVLEYRIGLIARRGQEVVDFLEGPHEPAKYTIDQAREIKEKYKRKLKEL